MWHDEDEGALTSKVESRLLPYPFILLCMSARQLLSLNKHTINPTKTSALSAGNSRNLSTLTTIFTILHHRHVCHPDLPWTEFHLQRRQLALSFFQIGAWDMFAPYAPSRHNMHTRERLQRL
jgi:hypothetical protein